MTNIPQDASEPLTHAQRLAFYGKIQVEAQRSSVLKSRCHLWTGSLYKNGYGQYMQGWTDPDGTARRKGWKAHRLAWILAHGPIPKGLVLDHLCDNRACCNVEHMRLCTQAENVRRRPGIKLDMEAANEIRAAHAAGRRQVDLAAEYGVTDTSIWAVINMKSWVPANDNQEPEARVVKLVV